MKSVKLTNSSRYSILRKFNEIVFSDEQKALESEESALGDRVLDHIVGKHKKAFECLPPGFIRTCSSINVNFGSNTVNLPLSAKTRVPDSCIPNQRRTIRTTIAEDNPLFSEWTSLTNKQRLFLQKKRDAENQLNQLLASVSTTKQLRACWDRADEVLPAQQQESTALALPIDSLNSLLDGAKNS